MSMRILKVRPGHIVMLNVLGLLLTAAGCSPKTDANADHAPANKNLKHIDELLKKGCPQEFAQQTALISQSSARTPPQNDALNP